MEMKKQQTIALATTLLREDAIAKVTTAFAKVTTVDVAQKMFCVNELCEQITFLV